MAEVAKDTIYIDVDDEITSVIDKVLSSNKKLVALVLPKRAAVFQSVVNMKLLKLKTDNAGKNLVLITTESSLLPLAGSVGLYVAKTLSSKPEIPVAPMMNESIVEANEEDSIPITTDDPDDVDLAALAAAPVGVLAAKKLKDADDGVETIELDNESSGEEGNTAKDEPTKPKKSDSKRAKKDKNLSVPNFERFRKWLIIGLIGLVILIVGGFILLKTLPKATIYVQTDASNVNTSTNVNLSTTAKNMDSSTNTVPAKQVSEIKTYTATTNATGQQNNGQKATGTVSMTATECGSNAANQPNNVPAGSGIVQNGTTYITQTDTVFPKIPSKHPQGCFLYNATSSTSISAQQPGANSNTSSNNASFSVPGRSDITATGSASGGTDNVVTVVSQTDITTAENKIVTNTPGAKQDLASQLTQNNYYPIQDTFNAGTPTITPNQSAGAAASSVTVTETINYTMYGARENDLNVLLNSSITSQVGSNQSILNNGLSKASFSSNSSPTALTMQTTAVVGPNINVATIKQQAAGKKSAEIQASIGQDAHVTSVVVKFSPFYVSTAPTNTSKITVFIAKPTNSGTNASH
jgi:hypothetical protein